MKVLLVGAGYPPEARGGTEVHMHQLGRALRSRGHDVHVFCRSGDLERPDYALERSTVDGISVARVNYNFKDATDFAWIHRNDAIDRLFGEELDRIAPDVVHVHHLTCLSTTLLDRIKDRGHALVFTLHDFWMVCPRGQRMTRTLDLCTNLDRAKCVPCLSALWPHFTIEKATLERLDGDLQRRLARCDLLLTPSSFHRDRMLEIPLAPERVRSLPHGLDTSLIPERSQVRFPPRNIGFIGAVLPTKGVHVLIDAMNLLGDKDLTCHVFGEVGNFHGDLGYGDRLRAQARADLPFTFHGAYDQADLPRILDMLDVLVVPSLWWETFCLTIREAMLGGVPVLASDLGAMHEALAPLHEDMLFRPGDPADLAHKLFALQRDEARYRRLGQLRGRVKTRDAMALETEAAYRELVGFPERRVAWAQELSSRKRKGTSKPYVTVFIPTWNGGPLFEHILDKVRSQITTFEFEVLCIDSGSRDGTVDVIRARTDVRLIEIPNSEFNHGLTRNRAVREAHGEIVALLTQDAEPCDDGWLQRLIDNFDDPDVAGAYCHQLPRDDCNPFQRDRLKGWTRGEGVPERKRLTDPTRWNVLDPFERLRLIAFDDVASSVRKTVMERIPFEKRQFGEDVAWGKAAILGGHCLVMDPGAVVIHSHNNPIWYEFKRVYLDHQNLHDLTELRTVPSLWLVCKCSVHLTARLLPVVWRDDRSVLYRLWWTLKTPLYAFSQNLAQFLGARSVLRRRAGRGDWIDRRLRRGV